MIRDLIISVLCLGIGAGVVSIYRAGDVEIARRYRQIRPGDWFMKANNDGKSMMSIPGASADRSGLKRCEELLENVEVKAE